MTIPVSLVAAALVLDHLGETFNAISFAGLAVAIVLVIDDAVVSAEHIARRGRSPSADAVLEASREIRSPLTYATAIALLATVPIAVMEGRPGAFFEPLAFSYALAVGAAMLVALTLTPALSVMLPSGRSRAGRESPLVRWLAPRYARALSSVLGRPRRAFVATGAAVIAGLALLPLLGTSLIPSFKDRDVLVRLAGEPGTSNPRMTGIATAVGRELQAIPGVDKVAAHVGRAKTGDQVVDVNSSELWVSIGSDADHGATVARIEDVVERRRGVDRDVVTYSAQRIRDVGALTGGDNPAAGDDLDVLTGSDQPLVVRVYGQDLATLRRQAERVRRIVSAVDGVINPRLELPVTQPTIEIETDLARARQFGVKPGDVRRAEGTLLQGLQVGSIFEEQKVFDVIVQGVPATRASVASVRNLLIDGTEGDHVRLGRVADVQVTRTPLVIERDAVSRRLDVETGVSGRSLGSVASEIEDRLANMSFPLEYHAEVLRQTTGEEIDSTKMLAFAIAAAIAALLLFQAAFASWSLAVLGLLTLPVALVGGLPAAVIGGGELSLGSFIGFLALLGLAARTNVLLIRRFEEEPVELAARERLHPIVTSACAIAVVMLPLVVAGEPPVWRCSTRWPWSSWGG